MDIDTGAIPPTLVWRGRVYDTPDLAQLQHWVFEDVCETPEGDIVEPDHPDSWLSLLGLN